MAQIGNVQEIRAVKDRLNRLKEEGTVREWEIPYENILTRLSSAIFFLTPANTSDLEDIWGQLKVFPGFTCRLNTEQKLSSLAWRVEYTIENIA